MNDTRAPSATVLSGDAGRRLSTNVSTLVRDPGLLIVIAIIIMAVMILPNPLDQEGGIDAFIYNAYSLNFSNLINRYGPWYFSYRIAHLFWLWLAHTIFGYYYAPRALAACYLSTIAISSWIVLRPHLPRLGAAGIIVLIVLSSWTIKTVATTYLDGTSVAYLFVLICLLILDARANFADRKISFAAGCVLGLIVNANTYLIVFGFLLFLAHFATSLEKRTLPALFRSAWTAVLGFVATGVALWLIWAAILVIGSGTPISAILRWTMLSLRGGSWDADMFGRAVGLAQAHILSADPRPFVVHMLRDGEVRVLFPPLVTMSVVLYRLWAVPLVDRGQVRDRSGLRHEWDTLLVSAVLIVGFCYVTSESAGNQMLSAPYYFDYMLPVVYLSAALGVAHALSASEKDGPLRGALMFAGLLAIGLYAAAALAPSVTLSRLSSNGAAISWGLIAITLVAAWPLWQSAIAGSLSLALLILGSPLFLASSSGYYRLPYSRDLYLVSRDILDAQVALTNFVERTAPPPGVNPNGHPVIFWYPDTAFAASLSGTYISDYQALHAGHGRSGLPNLDERAISQLKAGYRRDIVLISETTAQLSAAEKALHDLGIEFDVIAHEDFTGAKRVGQFTYIRITKPAT